MLLFQLRISDGRVLKLLKAWLRAGVVADGQQESTDQRAPQDGVISPLLANIYLDYLDRIWRRHLSKVGKVVRYADDSVVLCRTNRQAGQAYRLLAEILSRMDLQMNEEDPDCGSVTGERRI